MLLKCFISAMCHKIMIEVHITSITTYDYLFQPPSIMIALLYSGLSGVPVILNKLLSIFMAQCDECNAAQDTS